MLSIKWGSVSSKIQQAIRSPRIPLFTQQSHPHLTVNRHLSTTTNMVYPSEPEFEQVRRLLRPVDHAGFLNAAFIYSSRRPSTRSRRLSLLCWRRSPNTRGHWSLLRSLSASSSSASPGRMTGARWRSTAAIASRFVCYTSLGFVIVILTMVAGYLVQLGSRPLQGWTSVPPLRESVDPQVPWL